MARNDNAYLYTHTRPDTGQVFYVGIGCSKNYKRAFQMQKRSEYWRRIKKKAGVKVSVLIDNITWREAESWERYLINLHGRSNLNNGPLCNLTDGGEGTAGRVVSEEVRNGVRQRMKGVYRPHAVAAAIAVSKRPVLQYSMSGEFIQEFDSAVEAARILFPDRKNNHISEVCWGRRPSDGGFLWKFKDAINRYNYARTH